MLKSWLEKNGLIALVLLVGVAFMIFGNIFHSPSSENSETTDETAQPVFRQTDEETKMKKIADYEERYEAQLKEALEAIVGVGEVKVVVNVDATETKILEKNQTIEKQKTTEEDKEGGKRNIEDSSTDEKVVIVRKGDEETPIVLQTKKPEIRGVLVVAKGAEKIQIKKWIVEAVTRTLDVPSHRVAVLPKK
ncbi:stage III sporulation protein AG [Thermolongibacillus altinsuensis]|uniref:Stage III sporulation protein AG n=1 Tax=Thermolongibacillus altinsuensis TaxID=575256 RepID=A0A4R1QDA9_9BACL|nr:stage III sporulation protein AG [Thermolongibacillus altinsuensis]TCL48766.1 stage III sporulation protein AG [Thermolongibacillus altinsuensis]